jgi:hypothetical protein
MICPHTRNELNAGVEMQSEPLVAALSGFMPTQGIVFLVLTIFAKSIKKWQIFRLDHLLWGAKILRTSRHYLPSLKVLFSGV